MFKRMISLFLAAVLILGFSPVCAPAQASETSPDATAGQYAILDLEMSGGADAASALVVATAPCTVMAALYTESGRLLEVGMGQAAGGGQTESVEIPLQGMGWPDYFVLKAFLLGEDLAPLCSAYTCTEYTREYQQFMAATVHDFEGQTILSFDEELTLVKVVGTISLYANTDWDAAAGAPVADAEPEGATTVTVDEIDYTAPIDTTEATEALHSLRNRKNKTTAKSIEAPTVRT